MIEVSVSAVNFGELAVDDTPSYRHIKVRNTENTPVCVHLSATVANVKFQLRNENAFLNTNDMDDRESYNELFDTVNLVDSIMIPPNEEGAFVAFFRAERAAFSHLLPQSQPVPLSGSIQLLSISGGAPSTFPRSLSSTSLGVAGGQEGAGLATAASPTLAGGQPFSSGTVRSESISLPMLVSVYLSRLQVSPVELQATMAPSKTQCLDFTVTNVSSRPLPFVIRSQSMAVKGLDISLYEAERFEEPKLGHRILLDSNASINLSLMLRTTASSFSLQQYQSVLQCDNLRDPQNTVLINVSVNIASESQGDLISVSDTSIGFGDVYRGAKADAELGFLNMDGRDDVTVTLSSNYKRKANGEIFLMKDEGATDEFTVPAQKAMQYIKVVYKPTFTEEELGTAQMKFDLDFIATSLTNGRQQRIVVRCTANLFTSTIIVPQKNVNFGDCQMGESKRRTFIVENQSPLPGRILIKFRSKIISIEGASSRQSASSGREICEEFTIGPSSKLSVGLKISPQRVNPTYRKQLIIVNMANPNEDKQIINIEANNMAPPEAKVHNELYTWDCRLPGGVSQSVPLCTISNVPAVVPYSIKSRSADPIVLNIKSTCPEIDVLYCSDPEKTKQLEALASEWRSYSIYGNDGAVNELVSTPPELIEGKRKELVSLLSENGAVVTELPLEPKGAVTVFAVIIRSISTNDAFTKEDGLLITIEGVETPRFVRLSYRLCGTIFDVTGQKTKNFGEVNIGVKKTTKLPIVNKCKSVLFLKVSKSRSVTAGHIRVEHSDKQVIFVVVRPFATREVELSFLPGIKGTFDEKITLTNVLDPQNNYVLTLKAVVIKADTFDVSPDSWNFGSVVLPSIEDPSQLARVGAKFMVANTSKTRRQIRVKLDLSSSLASMDGPSSKLSDPLALLREMGSALFGFAGVDVRIQLDMDLSGAGTGSSRKIEEQIEKLEQKLRIHERKKKFEKMVAVKKRIETLKRALLGEEVDLSTAANSADHDYSESEDESTPQKSALSQSTELMMQLLRDGVPLPTMNAGESVAITFGLTCSRLPDQLVPPIQTTTLNLLLYEAKDQEVNRIFPIDITLVRPEEETDLLSASPSMIPIAHGTRAGMVPSSVISLASGDPGRAVSSFMGHPLIVLRNTIVNDHAELTILVKATSNTAVVVLEPRRCGGLVSETLDARFKFFPRNGMVRADDALRIVAECTPRSVGPQKYFVPVKNLQNAADVQYFVIELNPTEEEERVIAEPKQLTFHDVVTPCDARGLESQLLLIRSRFQFPHSLLVRSNKPSQVLLFEDAQCTIPLQSLIHRKFMRETVRVHVKFSPSPKSTHHQARQIRAGVIVEAIVANGEGRYSTIGKTVVNITTRVGSGLLNVSTTNMELGSIPMNQGAVHTAIGITNPSDTFPVRARVASASPNAVVGPTSTLTLRPLETQYFKFELLLREPGLFREYLTVHNLTCRQEPITIGISLLRRDDAITAMTPPSASGRYVLPTAAVARGEDGGFHLFHSSSASILIRNSCTRDLILASHCHLPLFLSSGGGKSSLATAGASESPRGSPVSLDVGGGRARAEARHTQMMRWTLMSVPPLTEAQAHQLMCHELVTMEGVAQVQVAQIVEEGAANYAFFRAKRQLPAVGQCVLLLPFSVPVAVSEGRAEPTVINLGAVGQAGDGGARVGALAEDDAGDPQRGGRQDGRGSGDEGERARQPSVRVRLVNQSQHLPLHLKVECPPTIRFTSGRLVIPPGAATEVEARLQLKDILTQGPFRFQAFFVNEYNPENDIAVTITGQYYWKVFRLWTKTVEDVHDTLTMPALHVEGSAAVPTVLSEEKLSVSATEANTELRIRVQSNPKLEGLVQLQVLHYDAMSAVGSLIFQDEYTEATGPVTARVQGDPASSADGAGGGAGGGLSGGAGAGAGVGSAAASAGVVGGSTGSGGGGGGGGQGVGSGAGAGAGSASAGTGSGANMSGQPGAGAVSRRKAQQQQQQRAQTVRVRCVLLRSDLASLASAFSGTRKRGSAGEALTFDKVAELERRRGSTVYANMWLGTVTVSNRLTNDEDVTVFGQLDPFPTFAVPSKLSVGPYRMLAASPATGAQHSHLVYSGELQVTNLFDGYTAELALTALISDQLSTPVTVQVWESDGGDRGGNESESDASEGKRATHSDVPSALDESGGNSVRDVTTSAMAPSRGATPGSTMAAATTTTTSTSTTFTNSLAGGSAAARGSSPTAEQPSGGAGAPHRFSVGPRAVATLHILIFSNKPSDMVGIQQSSLEQLVVLALVDENVLSSAGVVRLSVTPLVGDMEDAPVYRGVADLSAATNAAASAEERTTAHLEETTRSTLHGFPAADPAAATATPVDAAATPTPTASPHKAGTEEEHTAGDSVDPTPGLLPVTSAVSGADGGDEAGAAPPPLTAVPQRRTLALRNCTAVPDCPGAYCVSYSVPRGDAPQGDITIRNNLQDRAVAYTASVTSQSPLSWILLPSSSGVLEAGETQTLRLNLLTSEVGSFLGYVEIHNDVNACEVLYLRLSAEVYVPTSGEGLFEVVTSSGFRVSSNEVKDVSLGHLYGSQTSRAYIALELVNRSSVPLEFPVSVVKPFRTEVKSVRSSDALGGLLLHHRHHSYDPHPRRSSTGIVRHESRQSFTAAPDPPAAPPTAAEGPGVSGEARDWAGEPLLVAPPPPPYPSNAPVFEGKLIACHIHGVPTQTSQKYIVVDPKSRVRLAFVLSCLELRVPEGHGVFGETDVVIRCKQARDVNVTFRVRFEAYAPTFQVNNEVEVQPGESYARVGVRNALSIPQTFVFRSQSPVLYVVQGTGTAALDEAALAAVTAGANRAIAPSSFAELEVRGGGVGYFAVRLDVMRAAALLNYDKDDGEARPALCEHAFILNARNPRERVRMQFRQSIYPSSAASSHKGGGGVATQAGESAPPPAPPRSILVPSNSPSPLQGTRVLSTTVTKPVKVGGQHIGEHFMMRFAQAFTSTLTLHGERLLAAFAHYSARRDGDAGDATDTSSSDEESSRSSGGGSSGSGGDSGLLGTASSSAGTVLGASAAATTDIPPTPLSGTRTMDGPVRDALDDSATAMVHSSPSRGSHGDKAGALSPPPPRDTPVMDSVLTPNASVGRRPQPRQQVVQRTLHGSGGGSWREEKRYGLPWSAWRGLRALLLDLTWIVDELVFYSILLRNSRLIQGYCVFITATVCNHPVMKAWRQYRGDLPEGFNIFGEYLEMLDYLPCPIPS